MDEENPQLKRFLDCEVLYDGCKRKIEIMEGYIYKLTDLATVAPEGQQGDGVNIRLTTLDTFTEKVTEANSRVNIMKSKHKELERLVNGWDRTDTKLTPKGTVSFFKLDKLTTSISCG